MYVGFNLSNGLFALDKQNGNPLWNKEERLNPVHASPTFIRDMLYHPANGRLRALKAKTGEELWSFPLPDENDFFMGWTISSPAISGSKLYVGSPKGEVFAIDASSGKELWRYQTGEAIACFIPYSREGSQVISSPALSGNTVYIGSADGTFYALDAQSGKEVWSYRLGVPITSSAAISGNTVYVGTYDGSIYAFTRVAK